MATGFGPHMSFRYAVMGALLGLSLMQVDLKAHHRDEPSRKGVGVTSKPASQKKPWWQRILPLGKGAQVAEAGKPLGQSVRQRWTGPDLAPVLDQDAPIPPVADAKPAPSIEGASSAMDPVAAPPILSEPVSEKGKSQDMKPVAEKSARSKRRQVLGQKSRSKDRGKADPDAVAAPKPEVDEAAAMAEAEAAALKDVEAKSAEREKQKAVRDARWAEKRARRKAEKAEAVKPAPEAEKATEEKEPVIAVSEPEPATTEEPGTPVVTVEPAPAVKADTKKSSKAKKKSSGAKKVVEAREEPEAKEEPVAKAEPVMVEPITSAPAASEPVKSDAAGLYVRPDPRIVDKIRELQAKKRQMLMEGGSTYQIRKVDTVIAEMRRTGVIPEGI